MNKILGIDYGEKRIGLAIAESPIAEPLKIIKAASAIEEIVSICTQETISQIVVGISENQTKIKTQAFVDALSQRVDLPIHLQDETLSSYEVKEMFLQAKKKKSKIHGHIDHYSAALILQSYIDENHINDTI